MLREKKDVSSPAISSPFGSVNRAPCKHCTEIPYLVSQTAELWQSERGRNRNEFRKNAKAIRDRAYIVLVSFDIQSRKRSQQWAWRIKKIDGQSIVESLRSIRSKVGTKKKA